MFSHIHFLNILLIYSGWIPMIYYILLKKHLSNTLAFLSVLLFQFFVVVVIGVDFSLLGTINFLVVVVGVIFGLGAFHLEKLIANTVTDKFYSKKKEVSAVFLALIVIAPIIEEIYFRVVPYVFVEAIKVNNINMEFMYIILSSTMVVINHFQSFFSWRQFFQKMLIEGVLFSSIYLLLYSLWINIIAHIVLNMIVFWSYYKLKGASQ